MNRYEIIRESVNDLFEFVIKTLNIHLFTIGNTDVTIWTLIYFFLSVFLLIYLSTWFRDILANRILTKYKIDLGIRQSIASIIRYFIIIIGFIIIFQSAGIDFTALGFLAGALGVGIGFGLQGITNNFLSGIIILFERPIKVGDRIEVMTSGKSKKTTDFSMIQKKKEEEEIIMIRGDVVKIASRATTIITNDNISILIPNSDFINSAVINWSYNHDLVRLNIPVHVAHKEDPEVIKNLLLDIVANNAGVKKNPAPDVLFDEMGERSLVFNLRVWTNQFVHRPNVLKSQLYYVISKTFKEKNIETPFPQRDLHLKSDPLKILKQL